MLTMSDQVFNNANRKLRAFIKISRPIGWPVVVLVSILCMMTFQVTLHNPAYRVGLHNPGLIGLAILGFFFTAAGGYAINDYFDRESDAIVKPDRPIPSNQITPLGALQFSAIMFISALGVGLMINPLAFGIVVFNISFLLLYSSFVKKYSGFLSNITIGLVEGITIPIFAEAALFQRVSVVSLSFMGFILVGIGINVLKDVAGVEGDKTIGVSSLAIKQGKRDCSEGWCSVPRRYCYKSDGSVLGGGGHRCLPCPNGPNGGHNPPCSILPFQENRGSRCEKASEKIQNIFISSISCSINSRHISFTLNVKRFNCGQTLRGL